MMRMTQTLGALVLVGSTLAAPVALADTTRVLELQERLNRQAEAFDEQMVEMQNLAESHAEVDRWFHKARELPKGTIDFQHAQAQFVNARVKQLKAEVQTIRSLDEINEGLFGTVSHLIRALDEQERRSGSENLNRLSKASFDQAVRQLQGTERLMTALESSGVVDKHPELSAVRTAFRQQARRVVARSNRSRVDQVGYLRELQGVIEAQGVLMDVVLEDLRQKYLGLQTLQVTGTTRLVGERLQTVLTKTVRYFSQDGGDRDWDMIEEMQRQNTAGWASYTGNFDQSLERELEELANRGPTP